MRSSFRLVTFKGIPIGAHWSWIVVAALVTFSLARFLFPTTYPGLSEPTYVAMAVVAAVMLFVSILLHELGHALRAMGEGMHIDGITLWLFGGVARFSGMFPSAATELRIAVAGPAVSAVLAAIFGIATWIGAGLGWPDPAQGVVDYLWRINAIVLAFNLVPALPLDGGRVLRAWLWRRQQSFGAATRSAAAAGRTFGYLMITVGVLNLFSGARGTGGIWIAFLGWFVIQAANAEARVAVVYQVLAGRSVGDVMTRDLITASPSVTIAGFLDDIASRPAHVIYPVVEHDQFYGILSLDLIAGVPREARTTTTVRDVAVPAAEVAVVDPDTDVANALDELQEDAGRVPVVDDGRLLGILAASDVQRGAVIEQLRATDDRRVERTGILVWAVVTAIMVVAAGYLYHPPYVVVRPGPTLDVTDDISISGAATDDVNGSYLLTSVQLDSANALELGWGALTGRDILSVSEVVPEGVERNEYFEQQKEVFSQSRIIAAAAAGRAEGMNVSVDGSGALVAEVVPGSPAASKLRRGDVIVALDGEPVDLASEFQEAISSRPAGTRFTMTVERGGGEQEISLTSARLSPAGDRIVGIGVVIATRDFQVDLPFSIDFEERDIGGPSAGLVYALAVADLLDPGDYAGGRTIAATGTVDVEGSVGPIGGADAKATGAEDAGAAVFLVPAENVDAVDEDGLTVTSVTSLKEAIALLTRT